MIGGFKNMPASFAIIVRPRAKIAESSLRRVIEEAATKESVPYRAMTEVYRVWPGLEHNIWVISRSYSTCISSIQLGAHKISFSPGRDIDFLRVQL